jgi:hypothetical protein
VCDITTAIGEGGKQAVVGQALLLVLAPALVQLLLLLLNSASYWHWHPCCWSGCFPLLLVWAADVAAR